MRLPKEQHPDFMSPFHNGELSLSSVFSKYFCVSRVDCLTCSHRHHALYLQSAFSIPSFPTKHCFWISTAQELTWGQFSSVSLLLTLLKAEMPCLGCRPQLSKITNTKVLQWTVLSLHENLLDFHRNGENTCLHDSIIWALLLSQSLHKTDLLIYHKRDLHWIFLSSSISPTPLCFKSCMSICMRAAHRSKY
jgi:hypothetical protein